MWSQDYRRFNNNHGFTLIEAIVTIAIIGLLVAPIATLFSNTYRYIQESRIKLNVSELAQLYIENIDSKSNNELSALFSDFNLNYKEEIQIDDYVSLESGDFVDNYLFGFPKLPDGYTVHIYYKKDYYNIYNQPLVTTRYYDVEINIGTNANRSFSVSGNGKTFDEVSMNSTERLIELSYKRAISNGLPEIYLIPNDKEIEKFNLTDPSYENVNPKELRIKVNYSATDEGPCVTNITTDNDYDIPIKIYIDNQTNKSIKLKNNTLYVINGTNEVPVLQYLMEDSDSLGEKVSLCEVTPIVTDNFDQMIYTVTVQVEGPNGYTTELITTKVD